MVDLSILGSTDCKSALAGAWSARKVIKGIIAGYGVVNSSVNLADNFIDLSSSTKTIIINNFSKGQDFINSWEKLKPFIDYGIYTKSIIDDGLTFSTAYETFKMSYEGLRNDPKFQQTLGVNYTKLEKFYVETSKIKK